MGQAIEIVILVRNKAVMRGSSTRRRLLKQRDSTRCRKRWKRVFRVRMNCPQPGTDEHHKEFPGPNFRAKDNERKFILQESPPPDAYL